MCQKSHPQINKIKIINSPPPQKKTKNQKQPYLSQKCFDQGILLRGLLSQLFFFFLTLITSYEM